jgi:hypothetical protein
MIQDPGSMNKNISFKIYDVTGRLVKIFLLPTPYSLLPTVVWDCTDQSGRNVAGGIYFICLKSGGSTINRKVILLED